MGTIFAIANQKGGVGKTTTAVNLSACFGEAHVNTLLVDIDPQCNATVALGLTKTEPHTVYDLLSGAATLAEVAQSTDVSGLSVAPSSPDLAGANVELARLDESDTKLREALAAARDEYQYTLLDCPPSLGPLTVNALAAADQVLVPVQAEYFALEGLAGILDTVKMIQAQLNPRLVVGGIILTMADLRTRLAQDVEAQIREHFGKLVFGTVIPRNVRISEAPSYGKSVIHHDRQSAGAEAYMQLAVEVGARG